MVQKINRKEIIISSGTGEEEELIIKFVYPPDTPIANDTANLLDALADRLQKRRFEALVDQIMVYRQKCGYQIPLFPSRRERKRDGTDRQLAIEFKEKP